MKWKLLFGFWLTMQYCKWPNRFHARSEALRKGDDDTRNTSSLETDQPLFWL